MSDQEALKDNSQIQDAMTANVPKMAQYMKFIGILQIIGGALFCLTIIGALEVKYIQ